MTPIYKTNAAYDQLPIQLKLLDCPYCRRYGHLIFHGYLYGYADSNDTKIIERGRRIFCSNRNRKAGCGRTFSILLSDFIKKFIITAGSLWRFLEKIKAGVSLANAFRACGSHLKTSSIYRLYKRFKDSQVHIRSYLARIKEPPPSASLHDPGVLTIAHLKSAFFNAACPISEFQCCFQASFF